MGGYGLVNVIGGGFTEASTRLGFAPPNGLLAERRAGTESEPKHVAGVGTWRSGSVA